MSREQCLFFLNIYFEKQSTLQYQYSALSTENYALYTVHYKKECLTRQYPVAFWSLITNH